MRNHERIGTSCIHNAPDGNLELVRREELDGGTVEIYITENNSVYRKYIFDDGRVKWICALEFIELEDHPFFIATQAHPEFKSRFEKPSPLFLGLVRAALKLNNN